MECKAREEFHFFKTWSSREPPIHKWWQQVCEEAEEVNRIPFLVYSKNYMPDLLGLPPELAGTLFPEARSLTIQLPDLDSTPITLVEFDQLMVVDSDIVIDSGQKVIGS